MTVPVDFAPGKMFRAEWLAASTQSVGTVLFNVSTGAALMSHTIAARRTTCGTRMLPGRRPSSSVESSSSSRSSASTGSGIGKVDWWSGQINFAGCVAFGVAAVAAFITAAGSSLDPSVANWGTLIGAICFFLSSVYPCPGHCGRRHRRRGLPGLASRTPQHSLRRRRHEVRHHELRLISGPEFIRYEESHRDAVAMLKVDLERIPAVMGCSVDGDGKRPQCASIVPCRIVANEQRLADLTIIAGRLGHAGHPVAIFLNGHQEGVNRPRLDSLPCATASTSSNNESTSSVAVAGTRSRHAAVTSTGYGRSVVPSWRRAYPNPQRCGPGSVRAVNAYLLVGIGLFALIVGAEALVAGGSELAARMGVSPMIVGMTVVSIGTSLPELAVGIDAARSGSGPLAVGNIVGTNMVNLLLILGLSAAIVPLALRRRTIKIDLPTIVACAVLLWVLAADGELTARDGLVLLAVAIAYTAVVLRVELRPGRPRCNRHRDRGG